MKTAAYFALLWCLMLAACGRDDVNPADYSPADEIRPNEFVLRPETRILSAADKSDILGINYQGILVRMNSPMLDSIRVGSILVNTASDPGDNQAYFRRINEILPLNNNIALRTEDVNLYEAFSRYVIDSRSSRTIIRRSNYFPVLIEFEPGLLDDWVAVKAGLIPDVTGEISFDADSTYFTAQYDESGSIPFRLDMRIKDLRFDLTGVVTFKGEIAAGIDTPFLANPYPVIPIGETGLTLYALPKMEAMMKVEGQIVSPTIKITSGPHNFSMSYDERRAEPFQYDIRANIVPTVRQTADWSAAGSGSAELQIGAEIFLGITGFPNTAKAGFFLFGYATPEAARKGNFTDLQPRVTFDAEAGIGGKAFAELNFFNEFNGVLESPDIKFPITKWHLAALNTCTRYNDVDMYADNVNTQNELYLDVNCPGCTGSGFSVWVNDQPIDNGRVFAYGQTATITLPPGLELLNTIAIQDEGSPGCYLADVFMDRGYDVVARGTEDHLFLVSFIEAGLTGKDVDAWLGAANITVNKNAVPNDPQSPFVTSGIRVGTPAITTRGFDEDQSRELAGWMCDVIDSRGDEAVIASVKAKVLDICARLPVYER